MTERVTFLTEDERGLLSRASDLKKAQSLVAVESLAASLGHTVAMANFLRALPDDQLRKIGRQATKLLMLIGDFEPVDAPQPVEETVIDFPTEDAESIPELVQEKNVPVVEEQISEQLNTVEQPIEAISQRGIKWLVDVFGEAWLNKLGLTQDELKISDIADAITAGLTIRKPNTPERVREIFVGFFTGLSNEEIAASIDGLSESVVAVFLSNTKKRFQLNINANDSLVINEETTTIPESSRTTLSELSNAEEDESSSEPKVRSEDERLVILEDAMKGSRFVSKELWQEIAEAQLREVAGRAGYSEEQTTALWDRIHFEDGGRYKQASTPELEAALLKLTQSFIAANKAQRLSDKKFQGTALRVLVNRSSGLRNLDDVHAELQKLNPSITHTQVERYMLAAVLTVTTND